MKRLEFRARQTTVLIRATGATWLFAANVPEKLNLIQERTGHRSTTALRMYERTSIQQQQSVSSIISSASPKKFVSEITLPHSRPGSDWKNSKGEESKVAFDNCQNCTINVNIQYAGHKQ